MDKTTKGLKIAIALLKKQNNRFKKECNIGYDSWQFEQAMSAIQQALKENNHG